MVQQVSGHRGVVSSSRWDAVCKDCRREGKAGQEFAYPDAWIQSVIERGGSRSDRCPICRKKHARDARSFAAPYVDIDVIGMVADPENPTGFLGGLGPLPVSHQRVEETSDLSRFDFGLDDAAILRLLNGLRTHQVALVVAGTGTGKSTFLPYRLLQPPEGATFRPADNGTIVVTEPRRLAAIDTATFVAKQLHRSEVGAGSDIGYRVQDEPAFDGACRLLYVTDGSLINWIRDGRYKRFGVIMVDEAHERSKNIDIILGLLRELLPQNPTLRLIIASATIDPTFFVEYFGGPEKVFQIEAPSHKAYGYGTPLWPLSEIDLDHPDWQKPGPNGENLRTITESLLPLRILDAEIEPGQQNRTWREQMPKLVARQALFIVNGTKTGDVLAFLQGEAAINEAVALIDAEKPSDVDVYPLLRNTPPAIQELAKGEKTNDGRRRIVVSTNIAETSLTIDGITYVVDSGLINQSAWDSTTSSKSIPAVPHSQAGVRQRWGRVGRKAPGWVFPLYTERQFRELLPPNTPAESTRDDLEGFVLTAMAAGIDDPTAFPWPASLTRQSEDEAASETENRQNFTQELSRAWKALALRGAVDHEGDITAAGLELQSFSGAMTHAAALAAADAQACAIEVATALSLLSRRRLAYNLFQFERDWSATRRHSANLTINALRAGCVDDLEVCLKVFALWEAVPSDRRLAWAEANSVDHSTLKAALLARDELLKPLLPGRKSTKLRPIMMELIPRVREVFQSTLRDQLYRRSDDGAWLPVAGGGGEGDKRKRVLAREVSFESATQAVAFLRVVRKDTVELANVVAIDNSSQELPIELANSQSSSLTRVLTRPVPLGSSLEELCRYADQWQPGESYLCRRDERASGAFVVPIRRLTERLRAQAEDDAPTVPKTSQPQDKDNNAGEDEETAFSLAIREALGEDSSEAAGIVSELIEEPAADDESTNELFPNSPAGIVDETQDAQYIAVTGPSEEADEEAEEAADSQEKSGTESNTATAIRSIGTTPPLKASEITELPNSLSIDCFAVEAGTLDDRFLVSVLGYSGRGESRQIHVAAVPYHSTEDDEPNDVTMKAGDMVSLLLVRTKTDSGSPYLVTMEERTGRQITVDANEISFQSGTWLPSELEDTQTWAVGEVLEANWATGHFSASLLNAQTLEIRQAMAANGDSSEYRCEVVGVFGYARNCTVEVQTDGPERGPVLTGRGKDLEDAGVVTQPGSRFRANLAIDGTLIHEARVLQKLGKDEKVPSPKALSEIGDFHFDEEARTLSSPACMDVSERNALIALRPSSSDWTKRVQRLWRASNGVALKPLPTTTIEKNNACRLLEELYPARTELKGVVTSVRDDLGVFVEVEGIGSLLARKENIGAADGASPSVLYRKGDRVQARVLRAVVSRRGLPTLQLEILSRLEQEVAVEDIPDVTIDEETDITLVVLEDEPQVRLAEPSGDDGTPDVDESGLLDGIEPEPAELFENSPSESLPVIEVAPARSSRELEAMAVIEQLPVGERRQGVIVRIDNELGALVRVVSKPSDTVEIPSGLVRKADIGSEGVLKPSDYLRSGDEVDVEVLRHNLAEDHLSLEFAIIDSGVPTQVRQLRWRFPPGQFCRAVVSDVIDELGVFATIEGCFGAFASKANMGVFGVSVPSAFLRAGDIVPVEVIAIPPVNAGERPHVEVAIRQLPDR